MATKKYNPLELDSKVGGLYLQRFPVCTLGSLGPAFGQKHVTKMTLYYLIQEATVKTYLSGEQRTKPVKITAREIAEYVYSNQPTVSKALQTLEKDGWIKSRTTIKDKKTKEYLVNFEKVTNAIIQYQSAKNNPTERNNDEVDDENKPTELPNEIDQWVSSFKNIIVKYK